MVIKQRQRKTSMNGLLGTFFLKNFNEFFNLCEDLSNVENAKIRWYGYTNITSSGDYIRAKSRYYNEPSFSDVSINMSEEESEDYNTDKGACFGKVQYFIII